MNPKRLETDMTDATMHPPKDLQTAITELVLDLRGDGKIETLAEKLNMSRNRLAKIFQSYQRKMNGEEPLEEKTPPWGLDSLEQIAHELGIPVSEIIVAAEDVQKGLPPWFQYRISRNTEPKTQDRLANIILEALGCHAYGDSDPMKVKGERKSLKYGLREQFSGDKEQWLKLYVKDKVSNDTWKKILAELNTNDISDAETYRTVKKILPPTPSDDFASIIEEMCKLESELAKEADKLQSHLLELISDLYDTSSPKASNTANTQKSDNKKEI